MESCNWRVLKMTDEQGTPTFKLFRAFWPWRREDWWLNSGITQFEETEESYIIDGVSGSQYEIAKNDEGDSPTLDIFIKEAREDLLKVEMMKSAVEISSIDEYRRNQGTT